MTNRHIRSFLPKISEDDQAVVMDAVKFGWGDDRSKYIELLEKQLAQIAERKYVAAVSHGTDAIQLALSSLELSPGDEVIVPDLTWVACVSPIIQLGLVPVFCNVDSSTCMSIDSFKAAISPKTKAAIVVDLAGFMPDWDSILEVAREKELFLIEDAAESFGAFYKGRPAGSFGDISILSFSATKVITGGHGGAIMTNESSFFKKICLMRHHGIDVQASGKFYWSTILGNNFQMSNLQAALIYSQLKRLPSLIEYKKDLFNLYKAAFSEIEGVNLVEIANDDLKPSFWLYVARINQEIGKSKEEIISCASRRNLDLRPFFYLLSDMPPFKSYRIEQDHDRENTIELSKFGICLPYGYDLDSEIVQQVAVIVSDCVRA